MIFPYRVDIAKKTFSWVTTSLIATNAVIFFTVTLRKELDEVIQLFGFIPERFQPHTLVTSMFVHGGLWHLLFNMLYLWVFGSALEHAVGRWRFIAFYFAGGVLGNIVHAVSAPEAMFSIPCVGASGAVSALLGACVLLYPGRKVQCMAIYFFRIREFAIHAFVFIGLWFLGQLLAVYLADEGGTGVAYWAHIGGFIFGGAFGLLFIVGRSAFGKAAASPELSSAEPDSAPMPMDNETQDPPVPSEKPFLSETGGRLEQQPQGMVSPAGDTSNVDEPLPSDSEGPELIVWHRRPRPIGGDATLGAYQEVIEANLSSGQVGLAVQRYAELEEEGIGGSLNVNTQRHLGEILLSRGELSLGVRALLRAVMLAEDPLESARIRARLGIVLATLLDNVVEGKRFLEEVFERLHSLEDERLQREGENVVIAVEDALEALFRADAMSDSGSTRYAVICTLTHPQVEEQEKIVNALTTIGNVDGYDLGVRLANEAVTHLEDGDDTILQNLTLDTAMYVERVQDDNQLPIKILNQRFVIRRFRRVHVIRAEVDAREEVLRVYPEMRPARSLKGLDILYVAISSQLRLTDNQGSRLNSSLGRRLRRASSDSRSPMPPTDYFLDVYTADPFFYRITQSSLRTERDGSGKDTMARFETFVKEVSNITGPSCLDESVWLFLIGWEEENGDRTNVFPFEKRTQTRVRLASIYRQA